MKPNQTLPVKFHLPNYKLVVAIVLPIIFGLPLIGGIFYWFILRKWQRKRKFVNMDEKSMKEIAEDKKRFETYDNVS